jgi:spore germination protein GerM
MTLRRGLLTTGFTVVAAMLGWLMFVALPRWYGPRPQLAAAPAASAADPSQAVRKIKARLFYVDADGMRLTALERDVAYAERPADQAREILNAQIAPVTEPLVSAIPASTKLRALFVTPTGEAFVDLTGDVQSAHPGGSLNELLTVYTIVDALTENMPAITAVQVLVDGKEVETLAGHVDLRRPLAKNLTWIDETRTP